MSTENKFLLLPISEIHVDQSLNARRTNAEGSYDVSSGGKFAGHSTIASLRNSIKKDGLQSPVLVREMPEDWQAETKARYQLLAGYRRMESIAGIKGMDNVPATVMPEGTTLADALAAGLVENLQRNQLSAAETAIGLYELREEMKDGENYPTYEKLSKRVGLSRGYVNSLVNLRLRLAPEIWEAFERGHEKATVRTLCDVILDIEDPVLQLDKWQALTGEKPDTGAGAGAGDGEGGDDDGETPPANPKALTRKKILEAIEFLKTHRKNATAAQTKDATYYRAATQWLEYAAGEREKPPLKIRTYEEETPEE